MIGIRRMRFIRCNFSNFNVCAPFKVPFYESPVLVIYFASIHIIRIDDLITTREYDQRIE